MWESSAPLYRLFPSFLKVEVFGQRLTFNLMMELGAKNAIYGARMQTIFGNWLMQRISCEWRRIVSLPSLYHHYRKLLSDPFATLWFADVRQKRRGVKQNNFTHKLRLPADGLFSLPDHENFHAGKNPSNSSCHCHPKCRIVS